MESYGEWRVRFYDVIFGELTFLFLKVTPLNYPNYTENQILESWPLMVTLKIVKSLRFGELAVSSNSPNC